MGPLRLSVTACASRSPGCPAAANGASLYSPLQDAASDRTFLVQLLVAIRLPDGATPPGSFDAAVSGGGTLAFTRSASYESELQTFEPAPAGERWWGWLSGQAVYGRRGAQAFSFTVEVPLPRPADGGALPSPLHWRPVVGGRLVDPGGGLPATRPVDCGTTAPDLYDGYSETQSADDTSDCVSSPGADGARGFLDAPLTDFGLSGSTVQASAGATTTTTFVARRSGAADPATTFALAVAGGPPGAAITLDRQTVGLAGDATNPVTATVVVPVGTVPGSYPITLTATAAGKPTRTGVATVVVPAPPPVRSEPPRETPREPQREVVTPPARDVVRPAITSASLSARRFRAGTSVRRAARGRAAIGASVRVRLSEAATVLATVSRTSRGRRVKGRCVAHARRGASCQLDTRIGTLPKQALKAGDSAFGFSGRVGRTTLPAGSYRLTLVATDAAGNSSGPRALAFTIVRR